MGSVSKYSLASHLHWLTILPLSVFSSKFTVIRLWSDRLNIYLVSSICMSTNISCSFVFINTQSMTYLVSLSVQIYVPSHSKLSFNNMKLYFFIHPCISFPLLSSFCVSRDPLCPFMSPNDTVGCSSFCCNRLSIVVESSCFWPAHLFAGRVS